MTARKNVKSAGFNNRFRVIAGRWRGRRLSFAPTPGLRPTPDRVRETVFNWLAPTIDGSCCLDLYAGSGALGIEALSRGAAQTVFVDRDAATTRTIRAHLATLSCAQGRVVDADAKAFLKMPATPFDVVFLDPPFDLADLPELCTLLASGGWLKAGARIYLEFARDKEPVLPAGFSTFNQSRAGAVAFALVGQPTSSE